MNLTTASSSIRAKEVGIRKTNGASRKKLRHQFFSEAIIISILALILAMGLVDVLVSSDELRAAALALANEIASASPLGVVATRATLRAGVLDKIIAATNREKEVQDRLRLTEDFKEGISASSERRKPGFKGR